MSATPKLSVVIPVYNEERSCHPVARLYRRSTRSASLRNRVRERWQQGPLGCAAAPAVRVRRSDPVVLFHANFGQHSAVMAVWRTPREYVVTLDADLQNLRRRSASCRNARSGLRLCRTIRQQRQDSLWRRWFPNASTSSGSGSRRCASRPGLHDARYAARWSRPQSNREVNTFIPALASLYA